MEPTPQDLEDLSKGEWIADSVASIHMTHSSSHFENYKSISSKVRIGDGSSLSVVSIGDISFDDASLHDVLHVPSISTNLFSISKATSKGLGVYFDDDVIEVIDRQSLSLIAHGYQSGGLYYISSFSSHVLSHDSHVHQLFVSPQTLLTKEDSDLWHFRFGHVSYASLQQMFSNSMVTGLPKLKTPRHHICSFCALGKQHRASFPLEASHWATHTLELMHADLAGPMEVSTLGGSRYYMLLVDDFSHQSWVCFLSKKSDALHCFQTWLALVETQAQCKVSILRSDNGG